MSVIIFMVSQKFRGSTLPGKHSSGTGLPGFAIQASDFKSGGGGIQYQKLRTGSIAEPEIHLLSDNILNAAEIRRSAS